MHRPEIVRRVEHLVASGALTLRGIASLVGISRGTIATIKAGRHHHQRIPPDDDRDDREPAVDTGSGPTGRCPTCGGKVRLPCRACHCRTVPRPIRDAAEAIQREEIEPLGVRLVGEARRRYEEIYATKRAADAEVRATCARREKRRHLPRRPPAPNQLPLFDPDPPPWEWDDAAQTASESVA